MAGGLTLMVGGLGLATLGTFVTSVPAGAATTDPCTTPTPPPPPPPPPPPSSIPLQDAQIIGVQCSPPGPTTNYPAPGTCDGPPIACDPQPTTTTTAPAVVPAVLPEVAPPTTPAPKVLGAQLASTGANTRILAWVAPALIAFGALAVGVGGRRRRSPTKR
jgi:hypothetical protein